jgi:hypothetical protein
MATRKPAAKKAAPKAAKSSTKKAAPKKEAPKRETATALVDRKSAAYKNLSEKSQAWIDRWQDNGVAEVVNKSLKGKLHRFLGHNKGLFILVTTEGMYVIGRLSSTGKSFASEFETEDATEAWEFYDETRTGSYGSKRGQVVEEDEAPAKKSKKAAASKKAPASKKSKKSAPAKSKRRSKPVEDDDDLDDLLDD